MMGCWQPAAIRFPLVICEVWTRAAENRKFMRTISSLQILYYSLVIRTRTPKELKADNQYAMEARAKTNYIRAFRLMLQRTALSDPSKNHQRASQTLLTREMHFLRYPIEENISRQTAQIFTASCKTITRKSIVQENHGGRPHAIQAPCSTILMQ